MAQKRTIYRDKIWIDPSIVSDKYTHASNHVEYYCYHELGKSKKNKPYIPKDPVKEFKANKQTYVCFSSFMNVVYNSGRGAKKDAQHNRILYRMQIDPRACVKLSLEEQRRFVELSVAHRMLPPYVSLDNITDPKTSDIVIMLEGLTPAQVYMYLSQYRYLREDPGFVRSILHLHDEIGMNFYAAFVVSSRVSIDYTVHHFLTLQRRYASGNANSIQKVTVPFSTIVGLRRFAKKPHVYDKRILMNTSYGYEAANRIEKICKVKYEARPEELLEPLLIRALSALTDKTTKKYLEQYKRLKERIKYREKNEKPKSKAA